MKEIKKKSKIKSISMTNFFISFFYLSKAWVSPKDCALIHDAKILLKIDPTLKIHCLDKKMKKFGKNISVPRNYTETKYLEL